MVDVAGGLIQSKEYIDYWYSDLADAVEWWEKATTLKRSGNKNDLLGLYFDAQQLVGTIVIQDDNGNKMEVPTIDYYRATVEVYENLSVSDRKEEGDAGVTDSEVNYDEKIYELYKAYINVYDNYVLKKQSNSQNLITNLASFFKEMAWDVQEGHWRATQSSIQNALMYAILVVQSLIFFISYTKRLFYVLMLILVAPVVVVFDFFMKFSK